MKLSLSLIIKTNLTKKIDLKLSKLSTDKGWQIKARDHQIRLWIQDIKGNNIKNSLAHSCHQGSISNSTSSSTKNTNQTTTCCKISSRCRSTSNMIHAKCNNNRWCAVCKHKVKDEILWLKCLTIRNRLGWWEVCRMMVLLASSLMPSKGRSWEKWSLEWSSSHRLRVLITLLKCRRKIFKTITETWKLRIISRKMKIRGWKQNFNRSNKSWIRETKSLKSWPFASNRPSASPMLATAEAHLEQNQQALWTITLLRASS